MSASSEVHLRPAAPCDLDRIVEIHLASFHGFFLSRLGPRFLRVLYADLMVNRSAALLVAVRNDVLLGVVGGVDDEPTYFRDLRQRKWLSFLTASVGAVIRNPAALQRLWRGRHRSEQHSVTEPPATLLTLAVTPQSQGQGVGRRLVEAFSTDLLRRGVEQYKLTTDAEGNNAVIRFYEQLGFESTVHWITPEGRPMLTMTSPTADTAGG